MTSPAAACVDLDALQAVEREQLGDLGVLEGAIELDDGDRIVQLDGAVEDAADGDAAEIVAGVQVGDQHLQRRRRIALRRRHVLDDGVEERPQILAANGRIARGHPVARVRVQHRELDLVLGRVEIDEEVVDLVEHFLRARVGAVDLVQHDDGRQAAFERLPQHEPRLRQRAFGRVHEQHDAVDHRQRPLDLAAEVGVARRVHDVDQDVPVVHGRVLGHDGDAALALEVDVVHHAIGDLLIGAVHPALLEQRVHERGLAVVDVGDDGEVAPQRVGDL